MPISRPPPCRSACTAATGKGGADGMGANLWRMPVGESVAAALTGLIKPTACVWVHHQLLATPCRGGRKLNLGLLPFKTLRLWLAYLAIQTFGIVDSVAMAQAP